MGMESIHLSPGNKPENFSKRREYCGAIEQEGAPDLPVGRAATSEGLGRIAVLALPGLKAPLRLVDDVDAALAAHEAIVAVAAAQRFQRVTDLHGNIPYCAVD
jgi:hypothetical protein